MYIVRVEITYDKITLYFKSVHGIDNEHGHVIFIDKHMCANTIQYNSLMYTNA